MIFYITNCRKTTDFKIIVFCFKETHTYITFIFYHNRAIVVKKFISFLIAPRKTTAFLIANLMRKAVVFIFFVLLHCDILFL